MQFISVVIVFQLRNNCYTCKLHLYTEVLLNQLRYTQGESCMISFATSDYLFIYFIYFIFNRRSFLFSIFLLVTRPLGSKPRADSSDDDTFSDSMEKEPCKVRKNLFPSAYETTRLLYEKNCLRVEGPLSYPSHPGQVNFSYISLR